MHSVRIKLAKLILVGTRITYQAIGDAMRSKKDQNDTKQTGSPLIRNRDTGPCSISYLA